MTYARETEVRLDSGVENLTPASDFAHLRKLIPWQPAKCSRGHTPLCYNRGSMERAATGIAKLVADIVRRVPVDEAPSVVWPWVCGRAVAQRTKVLGFSDGVLRVEVPDAAWLSQLSALSEKYRAGVNTVVPEPVRRIVFHVQEHDSHENK
jgi:hypothetical protein